MSSLALGTAPATDETAATRNDSDATVVGTGKALLDPAVTRSGTRCDFEGG